MARVTGPSRDELDRRGDEFAARVTRAIRATLHTVALETRTVDDLPRIQVVWRNTVEHTLMPRLRVSWNVAVQGVRTQLEKINANATEPLVAAVFEIPKVSNPLAESFLAEAQNRLTAIGDVVWYTARGEMLTGLELGEGVAELRERVVASAKVSQKRAEVIARTEVNSAMNNGAYQQMKALDVATIKEWIATDDDRTRESHAEVDGEEIAGDAKFMVGGFPMEHPHDLNAPSSETINCVIGSTQVDTPLIQMAMRSWLDGDVIEIRTSAGKTLTVTPNHPVLTTAGWLLASQLKVGDNVLCGNLTRKLTGSLHNEQRRPTQIAEVFDSATSFGVTSDRECVANLHGEWREAKIRVVAEDRQLGLEVVPARNEEIDKLSLTAAYGTCACFSSAQGSALTLDAAGFIVQDSICTTCGVSALRKTTSVVNGGRSVASSIALSDSACLYFSVEQNVSNCGARDVERLTNGDHRFTLDVSTDDVISIVIRPYSGHVYNLSTTTGWYTGNSIITGNCRCTLAWEFADDDDDYEDDLVAGAAFHLPGQHNQKTHGHHGGGGVARGAKRLTVMKDAYVEGYTVDSTLDAGGSRADIAILTLSDGSKVVRKVLKKNETRREYLAGRVFDALKDDESSGVTTAQIDDDTIITTYAPGQTGGDRLESVVASKSGWRAQEAATKKENERQAKLPGAKEMAMLDALIENHDRHSLNWILSDDGIAPIDQGAARFEPSYMWNQEGGRDESIPSSPVGDYWFGVGEFDRGIINEIKPRYTQADITRYRANIAELSDEFQSAEEKQWFDFINRRLDQVEARIGS